MDKDSAVKKFESLVESSETYTLKADMDIVSNEEEYHYDITVDKNNEYYKVDLINTDNEHEQIILKNDKGVYVKT